MDDVDDVLLWQQWPKAAIAVKQQQYFEFCSMYLFGVEWYGVVCMCVDDESRF